MTAESGSVLRDSRLDRAVTWLLASLVTVGLGVGAWFFSSLSQDMRQLQNTIHDLRVTVALNSSLERRIEALEKRVDAHQDGHPGRVVEMVEALRRRLAKLEGDK